MRGLVQTSTEMQKLTYIKAPYTVIGGMEERFYACDQLIEGIKSPRACEKSIGRRRARGTAVLADRSVEGKRIHNELGQCTC